MEQDASGRALTVLVVDDEYLVRLLAVDALEDAGHRTIEAGDAEEALAVLQTRNDIDILFSDIRMPGKIDGIGLAHVVRRRWPNMPIILTSGHTAVPDPTVDADFIAKPYRVMDLLAQIQLH